MDKHTAVFRRKIIRIIMLTAAVSIMLAGCGRGYDTKDGASTLDAAQNTWADDFTQGNSEGQQEADDTSKIIVIRDDEADNTIIADDFYDKDSGPEESLVEDANDADDNSTGSDQENCGEGEEDSGMTDTDLEFYAEEISDELFAKMQGKSFKEDCTIGREELRDVHVLYVDFDGQTQKGEIVCNKAIAEDLTEIFEELYEAGYPIEKIRPVDEYDADDEASMADDNTSCFNFRFISHTTTVSNHGKGLAIDINPLYNPYVKTVNGALNVEPANAAEYVDRAADFPHKIDESDLAYKLFIQHGFTWGGSWKNSKDYQHFEKDI